MHIKATEGNKLDPKSQKMTFIGYAQGVKMYILWDSQAQRLVISRDVIFDEKSILERPRSSDGAGELKMDSGAQSQANDMQSTSTYRSISIEVELGRRDFT